MRSNASLQLNSKDLKNLIDVSGIVVSMTIYESIDAAFNTRWNIFFSRTENPIGHRSTIGGVYSFIGQMKLLKDVAKDVPS